MPYPRSHSKTRVRIRMLVLDARIGRGSEKSHGVEAKGSGKQSNEETGRDSKHSLKPRAQCRTCVCAPACVWGE